MDKQNVYEFSAKKADGSSLQLSDYKGQPLLIVNVASKCGYTPQYAGLEALYAKYRDKGLVVLGFPCDQFGNQEFGSDAEIQEFCRLDYGVTFPVLSKIKVNTADAHPLYIYLKSSLPGETGAIKWNFEKFLVDREGKPLKRYKSDVEPQDIEADIVAALA